MSDIKNNKNDNFTKNFLPNMKLNISKKKRYVKKQMLIYIGIATYQSMK